jgi:uncharacterized protein (DUF58 family)
MTGFLPMSDVALQRFLDPAVLARISDLELLARSVVEGFLGGLHRSPRFGASTDFAEHRQYMPGDDIRRVDWKVYARTDRYYVKEFEADTNTDVTIALDCSRSMRFAGTRGGVTKLDYGKYLAASLAYLSNRQRDRVGLVAFDDAIIEHIRPSARHLSVVLHALGRLTPRGEPGDRPAAGSRDGEGPGALDAVFRLLTESIQRRGIVVVVSDFYEPSPAVRDALAHLRGRGNDIIAFHVLDRAEREFPFDQASGFRDLESGVTIPVVPEAARAQYRRLVDEHITSLSRLLADSRIDYTLVDTSRPLDEALFAYLSNRQRLSKVR